jgi:hypothetical protein
MRPACLGANSGRMDAVAVVIGIAMFVILIYMVEGIDRV